MKDIVTPCVIYEPPVEKKNIYESVLQYDCELFFKKRKSHGFILVYDASDPSSFSELKYYLSDILEHNSKIVGMVLVANKIDQAPKPKKKENKSHKRIENLDIPFFETSYVEMSNIEIPFQELMKQIIKIREN
jgi:GTPase SAR1 family protein